MTKAFCSHIRVVQGAEDDIQFVFNSQNQFQHPCSATALKAGGRRANSFLGDSMFCCLAEWLYVRWLGSSHFECWQIGPAAVWLGSVLCSHAFGSSIKQLTESTLDYLSSSVTAVDTGDPHHSCGSHSYAHTQMLSSTRTHTDVHNHYWALIWAHTGKGTCMHMLIHSCY